MGGLCSTVQYSYLVKKLLIKGLEMALNSLEPLIGHNVSVITADGRVIVGVLKGFDQTVNVILAQSHERVYSSGAGVEKVQLGLYIIRGDNIAVIGEIDEELDSEINLRDIRAEPLNAVVH